MSAAPMPSLKYGISPTRSGADIPAMSGDYFGLFSVSRITAFMAREPETGAPLLAVYAEGPMRKKDGERGRHNRCAYIDLEADLPDWLADIVDDASARLAADR